MSATIIKNGTVVTADLTCKADVKVEGDVAAAAFDAEIPVDPRTKQPVDPDYANWTTHPNNPSASKQAAE